MHSTGLPAFLSNGLSCNRRPKGTFAILVIILSAEKSKICLYPEFFLNVTIDGYYTFQCTVTQIWEITSLSVMGIRMLHKSFHSAAQQVAAKLRTPKLGIERTSEQETIPIVI